jgi:hypothetical protein
MNKTLLALAIGLAAGAVVWAQPEDRDGPPPPHHRDGQGGPTTRPSGAREAFEGGPRGFRGRTGGMHERMTEEEVSEAIEILREFKPEVAQRIEAAADRNPERVGHVIGGAMPMVRELMWLKRNDAELYTLQVSDLRAERDTKQLAGRYREAKSKGDARAEALRQELQAKVAEHFQIRQQIRERRLARLEKRLQEFRDQIKEMQEKKDRLIGERVEELSNGEKLDPWSR